jgi:hypothetical protein
VSGQAEPGFVSDRRPSATTTGLLQMNSVPELADLIDPVGRALQELPGRQFTPISMLN